MKAQLNLKKDNTEGIIEVIGGYEIKDQLKARGYQYRNNCIADLNAPNAPVVSGWAKIIGGANWIEDVKSEMAWLASQSVEVNQGAQYTSIL